MQFLRVFTIYSEVWVVCGQILKHFFLRKLTSNDMLEFTVLVITLALQVKVTQRPARIQFVWKCKRCNRISTLNSEIWAQSTKQQAALIIFIIWLIALWVGKMNQIMPYDWLPEQALCTVYQAQRSIFKGILYSIYWILYWPGLLGQDGRNFQFFMHLFIYFISFFGGGGGGGGGGMDLDSVLV